MELTASLAWGNDSFGLFLLKFLLRTSAYSIEQSRRKHKTGFPGRLVEEFVFFFSYYGQT